jgi:hypothetical protein
MLHSRILSAKREDANGRLRSYLFLSPERRERVCLGASRAAFKQTGNTVLRAIHRYPSHFLFRWFCGSALFCVILARRIASFLSAIRRYLHHSDSFVRYERGVAVA